MIISLEYVPCRLRSNDSYPEAISNLWFSYIAWRTIDVDCLRSVLLDLFLQFTGVGKAGEN
jgi:hypothetical protein